eukprot:TRINITY_DN6963_c0_g1_i1.p1 TRINITY_DN6963_c0_g1~~TRINITY_DN6963_c0_g1_i1.p1  ORF type:complete len:398 (+),score=75.04 TRINITY_DN6963_c0_g1_i1:252-1445(+)
MELRSTGVAPPVFGLHRKASSGLFSGSDMVASDGSRQVATAAVANAPRKTYGFTADLIAAVAAVESRISLVSEALRNSCLEGADEEMLANSQNPVVFAMPPLLANLSRSSDSNPGDEDEVPSAEYPADYLLDDGAESEEESLAQKRPPSPGKGQRRRPSLKQQKPSEGPPRVEQPTAPLDVQAALSRRQQIQPSVASSYPSGAPQHSSNIHRRLALLTAAFPSIDFTKPAPERPPTGGALSANGHESSSAPTTPSRVVHVEEQLPAGEKKRHMPPKSSSLRSLPHMSVAAQPTRHPEAHDRRRVMIPSHTFPAVATTHPNRVQFPPVGPSHSSTSMEFVTEIDSNSYEAVPQSAAAMRKSRTRSMELFELDSYVGEAGQSSGGSRIARALSESSSSQ